MKHNCKFLKTANGVMKVADTVLHPRGCHSMLLLCHPSAWHWDPAFLTNKNLA